MVLTYLLCSGFCAQRKNLSILMKSTARRRQVRWAEAAPYLLWMPFDETMSASAVTPTKIAAVMPRRGGHHASQRQPDLDDPCGQLAASALADRSPHRQLRRHAG